MYGVFKKVVRQHLCSHVVLLEDIKRTSPDNVQAPCVKCGYVLAAGFGLALNARLVSKHVWHSEQKHGV